MSEGETKPGKIIRTSSGKGTRLTAGSGDSDKPAPDASAGASPAAPDSAKSESKSGAPTGSGSAAPGSAAGSPGAAAASAGNAPTAKAATSQSSGAPTSDAQSSGGAASGAQTSGGQAAGSQAQGNSGASASDYSATGRKASSGVRLGSPDKAHPGQSTSGSASWTQANAGHGQTGNGQGSAPQAAGGADATSVLPTTGSAAPATVAAPAVASPGAATSSSTQTGSPREDVFATGAGTPSSTVGTGAPARDSGKGSGKKGKKRKGPRTVRLTVASVDPWSVMKMSFLLSLAIGIVVVVASLVLWFVLSATGTLDSLQGALSEIAGSESADSLIALFGLGRVMSFAVIISVINIVLLTALATLFAFLYNLAASIVGGFHLTLTDD